MRYRPTDDEAAAAMTVARRRNTMNNGQSNLPGGETADTEERLQQHYVACLSEIATSRALNLCWTGCGKGSEGAHDVGGWLEVRAVTDNQRGLLIRRKDIDRGAGTPHILVRVNTTTRECELLGWMTPAGVYTHGRALDQDTDRPCWIMPPTKLNAMENLP